MTFRPTGLAALAAVVSSALAAITLQLGLLGALGSGNISPELPLEAAGNARVTTVAGSRGLRFDAARAPAVAQAKALTLNAGGALALVLDTEEVTSDLRLTLGWLTTQDMRRTASATAKIAANGDQQQTIVMLSGHPRWRETVTQIAIALEADGQSQVPAGAFLYKAEWVPANPLGGARLLATAWFQRDGNILTPNESANRLLPLALWLALICAASLSAVALAFRKRPQDRAQSLRTTAALLATGVVILTVLANRWPGWTVPLGGGVAAALALLLLDGTLTLPLSTTQRRSLALLAAGVALLLAPLVAAVAVLPALMLLLAQMPDRTQPGRWLQAGALLSLVPGLLLAAVAQRMIPAPDLLNPLADPTRALTAVASTASGLPGLALGMLAVHQLWPAPAQCQRWSTGALTAAVWALLGAVVVLTVPKIAILAGGGSTYTALFLPALACLALAILPKLQTVAQTVDDTVVLDARSEADLSEPALALFDSHAERVQATLARREIGAARAALVQMERIAPAARGTALARLRIALAESDLATASSAATTLERHGPLGTAEHDALLELAHRQNLQPRVIELAPGATRSEGNVRAIAVAQLLTGGPANALQALSDWPDEHTFARELAELHLLTDNIQAAQQALVNTGIALTDPIGQAYVARLGLRALGAQGPAAQGPGITQLAIWNPQLGAAHAAQGELFLRQGNPSGARARFLLATRLDAMLWPLQYRLQHIDANTAVAASPDTSVQEISNQPRA